MRQLRPGTRCECREMTTEHRMEFYEGIGRVTDRCHALANTASIESYQCVRQAVRIVTVRVDAPQVEGERYIGFDEFVVPMCAACAEKYSYGVPMCAACAEYREARQKERAR